MIFAREVAATFVAWLLISQTSMVASHGDLDYKEALSKAIIFLEAQRSGKLPPNHRPAWRGDSGLEDGKLANVDLVGGYYDAGDNVKYGLPLAFTVTTLAWSVIAFGPQLQKASELQHVHEAIRWGTDYLLKCAIKKNSLYVQVGDPVKDHECWVRPEKMKTPRTVLVIDDSHPGTEIAAETSAALAASAIVFQRIDKAYTRRLLNKAKMLFDFAKGHKGSFDGECPFYCSCSGYNDELMWAATWLYVATRRQVYLQYVKHETMAASVSEFSWDLKYAGSQMLLAEIFHRDHDNELTAYKNAAESFVCSVLPESPYHQAPMTPGGLIHLRDGANSQYVTGTAFLLSAYANILQKHNAKVCCGNKQFDCSHLKAFAKKQMDYLLGKNPRGRSYMVGFGQNPPKEAHHRGASVPMSEANEDVPCGMSFGKWFNKPNSPNPNELTGAILGGPDKSDNFIDLRNASSYTEPCTYINSLAIGALAPLASP